MHGDGMVFTLSHHHDSRLKCFHRPRQSSCNYHKFRNPVRMEVLTSPLPNTLEVMPAYYPRLPSHSRRGLCLRSRFSEGIRPICRIKFKSLMSTRAQGHRETHAGAVFQKTLPQSQ